jgi:hypothetical protein
MSVFVKRRQNFSSCDSDSEMILPCSCDMMVQCDYFHHHLNHAVANSHRLCFRHCDGENLISTTLNWPPGARSGCDCAPFN